jgi:Tfp pilus assembly protein PilO
MRRNEMTIGLALVVIGLIAAFWLVALSPKRERAASLGEEVEQLRSQLEQAEQSAAAGEQERKSFPMDYRKLVVLGKAVPEDGDQGSLLVQLQRLADRTGVRFQALELSASAGSAAPAAPPTTTTTDSASTTSTATTETTSDSSSESLPPSPTEAAAATEASAAALPIGASVGPAGLPVMPYQLKFTGDFFAIADFLESLDELVRLRRGAIEVYGRLLTVDGFALQPIDTEATDPTGSVNPIPTLTAEVSVTTYLTPGDQGLTAGASPTGPASAAPATPTPASAPVPGATTTPTASPAP